jgi:hypothetical protein
MEYIISFLKLLNTYQLWYILFILTITLFFILFLVKKYGIPYKDKILFKPINSEKSLPKYLKTQVWEKDIHTTRKTFLGDSKQIKIGSIGFVKDVVIFKFFGEYWNSASKVGKEGYDLFESEFSPPDFIEEKYRKEMECFVFVENCNLQTKLFAIIRQKAKNWKKVFVIASKSQIEGQELESLLPENGGSENIEIIQFPVRLGNVNE